MLDLKLKPNYITLTPDSRLHGLSIPVIGLTGGIATGKSSVSKLLLNKGFCVIDADKLIHTIYQESDTVEFIKTIAPKSIKNSSIDFKVLREIFFNHKAIASEIEGYLYKKLPSAFHKELNSFTNPKFVIYDVPLLFEKNLDKKVDLSITVYAPAEIQIQRMVKRDNSSVELAQKILDKQIPIDKKKELSEIVIINSKSLSELEEEVQSFILSAFQ